MYKLLLLSVMACIFAAPQDPVLTNDKTSVKGHPIELVDLSYFLQMGLEYVSKVLLSDVTTDIKDHQYFMTVTIKEDGFQDKDITVNAKKGLVWMQANSTETGKYYVDSKNLSECVDPAGRWNYEDNHLKMVFPLIEGCVIVTTETPNVKATESSVNHPA